MTKRRLLFGGALLALALPLFGCDNSVQVGPTAPGIGIVQVDPTQLVVSNAKLLVDGEVMNGRTMERGHGEGHSARFQAKLSHLGEPAIGYEMWVQYERPSVINKIGLFALYDDGTHGDHVADDGLYAYDDADREYGCHTKGAVPGLYHYVFFGVDHEGRRGGDTLVTVQISGTGTGSITIPPL